MRRRHFVGRGARDRRARDALSAALAETPVPARGTDADSPSASAARCSRCRGPRGSRGRGPGPARAGRRRARRAHGARGGPATGRRRTALVLYTDNGVTDPAASGEAVSTPPRSRGPRAADAAERMLATSWSGPLARRTARSTTRSRSRRSGSTRCTWPRPSWPPPATPPRRSGSWTAWGAGSGTRPRGSTPTGGTRQGRLRQRERLGSGERMGDGGPRRVADRLPAELASDRDRLRRARDTIDGCLAHLRPDGSSTTSSTTPRPSWRRTSRRWWPTDLSGSRRGVAGEALPGAGVAEEASRPGQGGRARVRPGGLRGALLRQARRATEGQAFFLLMEAAHSRLMRKAGNSSTGTGSS